MMRRLALVWVLVACGDDGTSRDGDGGVGDAAIDAAPIEGDFSCIETPWPTTAPDPLALQGRVTDPTNGQNVGDGSIEIRRRADDSVAATGTATATGVYAFNLVTGGAAQAIYRKAVTTGRLDAYTYDPYAVFAAAGASRGILQPTAAGRDTYYQAAGLANDPARGTLFVELLDCAGKGVVGAELVVPGAARVLYYDAFGTTLDPAATVTGGRGRGVVLGVPAGTVDVEVIAGVVTYRAWPVKAYADSWTTSTRFP